VINRVVVVVPAHDEEELLPACLGALRVAAEATTVPVNVTVVLDSCADQTEQVVRTAQRGALDGLVSVTCRVRNVGAARDLGMRRAIAQYGTAGLWLATTDADSTVPADWFARQLAHAANGAQAIVGTVEVADWSAHPWPVKGRYLAGYRPRHGHPHMHGANLSMSASAYLTAGGFPPTTSQEDVALVRQLTATGHVMVWAADLPVTTSARPFGRAPAGFAGHLRGLASVEDELGVAVDAAT
jgi:glycosyltransferase involved in cell wall biosynthesis